MLSEMLAKVCALQKQYGKTSAELEVLVDGFEWVLKDYEVKDIINAMGEYIKRNSDIPAPADIVKLIDEAIKYRDIKLPSIEKLKSYRDKGINLSPAQTAQLAEYEARENG